MKSVFRKILIVLVLCFSVLQIHCGTSSGATESGTDQVSIPAPVTHLSISSPDATGLVRVTAETGFADANTDVILAVNPASSGTLFQKLFLDVAYATIASVVTADENGAFQTTIAATASDTITVNYLKDGLETEATTEIPDTQQPLPATTDLMDFALDSLTSQAYIIAHNDSDGILYVIDLSTASVTNTITLTGATGASRVDVHKTAGEIVVIDTPNSMAYVIDATTEEISSTSIVPSTDVAAVKGVNEFALIAHSTNASALSLFDIDSVSASATLEPTTDADDAHKTTSFVATDLDASGNDVFALISQMTDNNYYVIGGQAPSFTFLGQTNITQVSVTNPGGLAIFSNGTEALVTDRDSDTVVRVDLTNETVLATIDVGDDPRGVIVNAEENNAYVVNSSDRTVSTIELSDNSVSTSEVILGLAPTEIILDPTGAISTIGVLNTGDESLTLLEEEDL